MFKLCTVHTRGWWSTGRKKPAPSSSASPWTLTLGCNNFGHVPAKEPIISWQGGSQGGFKPERFLPLHQCPPSTSQALRGCRTCMGKELHPGRLCSFLISYQACYEVANPLSSPPCPDQCFAVPGRPGSAAAGSSANHWPHAKRLSLPLPKLSGFASAIIRINKTPQINRKR